MLSFDTFTHLACLEIDFTGFQKCLSLYLWNIFSTRPISKTNAPNIIKIHIPLDIVQKKSWLGLFVNHLAGGAFLVHFSRFP